MRRCHAKQTRGDKHVTIQNKSAVSLEQEEDVKSEKDQDEMEEVDEEEEDDNSSSFKFFSSAWNRTKNVVKSKFCPNTCLFSRALYTKYQEWYYSST